MVVYLLVYDCNKFKAYYSLSRLCRENGFKKIDRKDLPFQMEKFKILEVELVTDI